AALALRTRPGVAGPVWRARKRIGSAKAAAAQDRLIVALTRSFDDVGSMSGLPESRHGGTIYEYTPLRRQSTRRLAFAATLIRLPLDRHRTSEKNCSNNPRSSSGGPSRPSAITGVATCAPPPPASASRWR